MGRVLWEQQHDMQRGGMLDLVNYFYHLEVNHKGRRWLRFKGNTAQVVEMER